MIRLYIIYDTFIHHLKSVDTQLVFLTAMEHISINYLPRKAHKEPVRYNMHRLFLRRKKADALIIHRLSKLAKLFVFPHLSLLQSSSFM